jgi:osmotically-inducible protein OsmY
MEVAYLRVEIDGDVVTLQGSVHSWYERRAAERAARSAPGITDVHNQLVVTL